jgi:chromosome segregation and condensation protein ScpB
MIVRSIKDAYLAAEAEVAAEITPADKEVTNKIEALMREVKGQGVSGKEFRMYTEDELSRIAGSLATLKVNLGEMMARAEASYRMNEDSIRVKVAGLRDVAIENFTSKNKKYTQGDIADYIEKHIFLDRTKSVLKEKHAKTLANLWWSLKSLLEVMLKRIEVLQNQRSDTRIGRNNGVEYDLFQQ